MAGSLFPTYQAVLIRALAYASGAGRVLPRTGFRLIACLRMGLVCDFLKGAVRQVAGRVRDCACRRTHLTCLQFTWFAGGMFAVVSAQTKEALVSA